MSKANKKFIKEARQQKTKEMVDAYLSLHPEFMNRNGEQKLLYPGASLFPYKLQQGEDY